MIDYEAIRAAVTMQQVLEAYGIRVTRGRALCPFHGDRHPSMKVYKDGYYCFACATGGDVVNFIARFDKCANKQAAITVANIAGLVFEQEDTYRTRERIRRAKQKRRQAEREQARLRCEYRLACEQRQNLLAIMMHGIPFSDNWCDAAKALPALEGELDKLFERIG